MNTLLLLTFLTVTAPDPIPAPAPLGDQTRTLIDGDLKRSYLIHVPAKYDPQQPTPVVLALHGAAMNAPMMALYSGLSKKSDQAGFIVVYPNGTGPALLQTWNAGNFPQTKAKKADDVAFLGRVLDDVAKIVNVDPKRVYACGLSNGAMMSYRLAAEMSDRIAAIAPVAGTIAIDKSAPKRPVPLIHFHGTLDKLVPYEASNPELGRQRGFQTVADSIQTWVDLNECKSKPISKVISKEDDELKVTRKDYRGGKNGSEVVLVTIEDGGHTWPGEKSPFSFLGKSTLTVSANDLMWEFFGRHPMK